MSITIIIGTSAAGLAAANKLRDLDPSAEIICLTKESSMPYNRCLLADFLGGSRTKERVHTKTQPFFAEKNIDLQLDVEVTGLDVVAKKIILRSGSMLAYDNLIIATGRSAFVPTPIDVSLPGIFPFYDLDHATDILSYQAATKARRVLVIGAGITGLECTDALHQRGLEVTVVERSTQVLARQIDNDGALFLQDLMARKGITLHLGTTVASVETLQVRNQPAYRVTLATARSLKLIKSSPLPEADKILGLLKQQASRVINLASSPMRARLQTYLTFLLRVMCVALLILPAASAHLAHCGPMQ